MSLAVIQNDNKGPWCIVIIILQWCVVTIIDKSVRVNRCQFVVCNYFALHLTIDVTSFTYNVPGVHVKSGNCIRGYSGIDVGHHFSSPLLFPFRPTPDRVTVRTMTTCVEWNVRTISINNGNLQNKFKQLKGPLITIFAESICNRIYTYLLLISYIPYVRILPKISPPFNIHF